MIALQKNQAHLADTTLASLAYCCADITTPPNPAPGNQPASPVEAGRVFAKDCLQTLPDFATIKTALAGEPFTIHSTFGTFYHNQQNLSIKVVPTPEGANCSNVLSSATAAEQIIQSFRVGINCMSDFDAPITDRPPRPSTHHFSAYSARTNAQ
jgi:hypothetical protein